MKKSSRTANVHMATVLLAALATGLLRAAPAPQLREKLVSGAYGAFDEIVFATRSLGTDPHWYANISYFGRSADAPAYSQNGRLLAYNVKTGKYRALIDDPAGSVRDPSVHYDGKTILFSYRPAGTGTFHRGLVRLPAV